ncbi:MAG: LPS export ABC transporter ATP-binding protein [Planctomycetes bacterium]|nr:LPS export ABC transporter ATP-binding protein [Planctomycetota bacterium]
MIRPNNLLQVRDITKIYGRRRVVDGVSLQVAKGEVVGLLGRNGAGKTTTFRLVIGLTRPDSGEIVFNDIDVTRWPVYRRARLGMGFLPQEPSVFQRLTVEENLLAILETRNGAAGERKERAAELLQEYGLERLGHQRAYTLSGGETRRLEICRALITSPFIILLDEPFSGVDPIAVGELQGFIVKLKQRGIGVLLTDHNVRETLAICDHSYIIDEGRLLARGTRDEIVGNALVRERYLGANFKL